MAMSKSKDKTEEKHVKFEEVAEETGELVGKGIRKTWSVVKSFGKGVVGTLEKEEKQKDVATSACPHCNASVPTNSNFCAKCGKKLL
jgi:ribosomal protein L40E